jgi:hypothetical protein
MSSGAAHPLRIRRASVGIDIAWLRSKKVRNSRVRASAAHPSRIRLRFRHASCLSNGFQEGCGSAADEPVSALEDDVYQFV